MRSGPNLICSSKHNGLEKAVFRIEQAIKRSKTQSGQSEDDRHVVRLQSLLDEAREALASQPAKNSLSPPSIQDPVYRPNAQLPSHNNQIRQSLAPNGNLVSDDNYAVDDAENPLQLLARASDLSTPPFQTPHAPNSMSYATPQATSRNVRRKDDLEGFFGPFRPSLDIGEDFDPIDLGLVTVEEVDVLFN